MRKSLLVLLCLVAAACQQERAQTPAENTANAAPPPAQTDTAADAQSVAQLRDQWVAAAEKDDAATVAGLYTDDAVLASGEGTADGRQAIQGTFGKSFPMTSNLKITSRELEVSGDLAYDYGEYTQRITPPKGKAMDVTGRYLVVLKRQAGGGGWQIDKHVSFVVPPAAK